MEEVIDTIANALAFEITYYASLSGAITSTAAVSDITFLQPTEHDEPMFTSITSLRMLSYFPTKSISIFPGEESI